MCQQWLASMPPSISKNWSICRQICLRCSNVLLWCCRLEWGILAGVNLPAHCHKLVVPAAKSPLGSQLQHFLEGAPARPNGNPCGTVIVTWLMQARDWAVSRSRFWGTPLPVWMSDDGEEIVIVGSVAELEELTGEKVGHASTLEGFVPARRGNLALVPVCAGHMGALAECLTSWRGHSEVWEYAEASDGCLLYAEAQCRCIPAGELCWFSPHASPECIPPTWFKPISQVAFAHLHQTPWQHEQLLVSQQCELWISFSRRDSSALLGIVYPQSIPCLFSTSLTAHTKQLTCTGAGH